MGAQPTTHVANGSPYPIWAKVETEGHHVVGSVSAGSVKIEESTSDAQKFSGFTKILPGDYFGFQPMIGFGNANWIHRCSVYITIQYETNGEKHLICEGTPKASNRSVIVNNNCALRSTKMGTIWTDEAGNNHKP